MRKIAVRSLLLALLFVPALATADGVQVRFDLSTPAGGPFPSDRFTVDDQRQLSGVRVQLPKPDCAERRSDCEDIDVINTLDGFNLQPRLRIPFTGPIDPSTVNSDTIFLVRLGHKRPRDKHHGSHRVVGINQVVWDPETNTLYAESDELLDQHTRWALIVTNGVRDAGGHPVKQGDFGRLRRELRKKHSNALNDYGEALLDAVEAAPVRASHIVAASVFTTQSATAELEKIRDRIKNMAADPATFAIGDEGTRAVFALNDIATIVYNRQIAVAGPPAPTLVPVVALRIFPGAVGTVAFGKFTSPDWETPEKFIPPIATKTGRPVRQGMNDIYFNLILPAGDAPPLGWPVAIFGHGFTDNKNSGPFAVAATMAAHGIATIAINVVGHGFGPEGTLVVNRVSNPLQPVTFSAGGRGFDQDGNGVIDPTEGVNAAPPRTIINSRDGLRQTVADLMRLVQIIRVGMDVDGDGKPDLDAERIYYLGQSFGGIYGVKFLAVEPDVRVGVPNVAGGAVVEVARLSPTFRPLVGITLASRMPPLINVGGIVFDENMPFRDEPPVVNTVPGAIAIQDFLDNAEWVTQSGNPVAYAPHIWMDPLDGVDPKRIIFQFAKGDQTVPNPTATAILRAGDLVDRTTYLRNDLVFATRPGAPKNPHTFLTNIANPAVADLAIAAQQQISIFFESGGATVIDPDGTGPYFEVPIVGPPPETLNFIP